MTTEHDDLQPGEWRDTGRGYIYRPTADEMLAMNERRRVASVGLPANHVLCKHDPPHVCVAVPDKQEQSFRDWMRRAGWFDAGYCEAYYPEYLRDCWRFQTGILDGVDDPLLDDLIETREGHSISG